MSKENNIKKKIKVLFKKLKIKKNDNIVIHSNFAGILQFKNFRNEDLYKSFFETVRKIIGNSGTILIPTYNYDFTRGRLFDKKKTESQKKISWYNGILKTAFNFKTESSPWKYWVLVDK